MGHEYEGQPAGESEEVVHEVKAPNASEDSDSDIKVAKQDTEEGSAEQVGEIGISGTGDHHGSIEGEGGDILEERDTSLPPKVVAETVTVREGVSKQVVTEGHGRGPPPRHSTCFGMPHDSRVFFDFLLFFR